MRAMRFNSQPRAPLPRKSSAPPRQQHQKAESQADKDALAIVRSASEPVFDAGPNLSPQARKTLVRMPTKLWRHIRTGLVCRKHIAGLSSWNHAISRAFRSFAKKEETGKFAGKLVLEPRKLQCALAVLGTPFQDTDPKLKEKCEEGNVDLEAFREIAEQAQRWHMIASVTREASLHQAMASLLPSRMDDILKMDETQLEEALSNQSLISSLANLIYNAMQKHRERQDKASTPCPGKVADLQDENESVMNTPARNAVPRHMDKFLSQGGFLGRFGDEFMFQGGLEQELGLADPFVLRAILREHMYFEDSQSLFLTPNYGVVTCPLHELARILGDNNHFPNTAAHRSSRQYLFDIAQIKDSDHPFKCPGISELQSLTEEFRKVEEAFAEVMETGKGNFPGEAGDHYIETLLDVSFECSSAESAIDLADTVNSSLEAMVSSISVLFSCDEEHTRGLGVVIPAVAQDNSVHATYSFPWITSAPEKEANFHKILQSMFDIPEENLKVACRAQRKYLYCEFTDSAALRKHLEKLSEQDLNEWMSKITSQEPGNGINTPGRKGTQRRSRPECIEWIICTFDEETAELKNLNTLRRQSRRRLTLEALMEIEEVKSAQLRVEEAIVALLYTGPMYQKWNSVLRQMPHDKNKYFGNKYTTTIHTLVSAVLKLSRKTIIPPSRKVYRGLDGIVLDEKWFNPDARNTRGGVELGFLSTTVHKEVALQYCGVASKKGTIFEIEIGKVDCGARVELLSQYPCEGELLFGPLANLEVVGDPILETHDAGQVVIVQLRININMKALTIEEMIGKRKRFQIEMIENVIKEVRFDVDKLLERGFKLTADQVQEGLEEMQALLQETKTVEPSWFNPNEHFRHSWNSALDLKNIISARWTFPKVLESAESCFWKSLVDLQEVHTTKAVTSVALAMCKAENLIHKSIDEKDVSRNECMPLALACLERSKLDHAEEQDKNGKRNRKVRLLLAAGADVNGRDKNGDTALVHAVVHGGSELIGLLIEAKADANIRNERDYTLLHQAAMKCNIDIVKALIAGKAMIESKDKDNRTPLHRAALKGRADVTKVLLQAKADVNARDQKMDTPLDWASNEECRAILIQAGGISNERA